MEDQKEDPLSSGENTMTKSQADFPPGMAPKMLKLVKMLNELETRLHPLISKQHHEVLNKISPAERAKIGLMEVYAINTLFWTLMKTSSESVDATLKDDYKIEMGRLKESQSRLSELEARAQRNRVNIAAASRFIHHGLGISRQTEGGEGDEPKRAVPNEMARLQRLKERVSFPKPRREEYEDEGDQSTDLQSQEETFQPSLSDVKNKKKRKKFLEKDSTYSSAEAEILESSSGYQASGEDSFTTPKKLKGGKNRKMKTSQESSTVTLKKKSKQDKLSKKCTKSSCSEKSVKKNKKKVGGSRMQSDSSGNGVASSNGYEESDNASPTTPKQKKKKKKKASAIESNAVQFLDTIGSGIKVVDRDLNNKSREWFEQGWT